MNVETKPCPICGGQCWEFSPDDDGYRCKSFPAWVWDWYDPMVTAPDAAKGTRYCAEMVTDAVVDDLSIAPRVGVFISKYQTEPEWTLECTVFCRDEEGTTKDVGRITGPNLRALVSFANAAMPIIVAGLSRDLRAIREQVSRETGLGFEIRS